MEIQGQVQNGVVVPEAGTQLPEGSIVTILFDVEPGLQTAAKLKRVQFPLVRSKNPGSLHLTNERIAEISGDFASTT